MVGYRIDDSRAPGPQISYRLAAVWPQKPATVSFKPLEYSKQGQSRMMIRILALAMLVGLATAGSAVFSGKSVLLALLLYSIVGVFGVLATVIVCAGALFLRERSKTEPSLQS